MSYYITYLFVYNENTFPNLYHMTFPKSRLVSEAPGGESLAHIKRRDEMLSRFD